MIGLDTNVLIRYFVRDDPRQTKLATSAIERCTAEKPGFINVVVLIEVVWVLVRTYGYDRAQAANLITALLMTPQLQLEQRELVVAAVATYRTSRADFSDIVISLLNQNAGCTETIAFDGGARQIMSLLGSHA